jgi:type IV pilus assembly protein PilN
MMRVNLLGGTAEHRVAVQKTKVAARRGQQLFMLAAALVVFLIAIGVDHLWTNSAHAAAQTELTREEEEAKKLEADIQRKNELEAELKQVDERIRVIKQLRAEQKGPVAMLSAINERMPGGQADFRLDAIVQKGSHLQIIGSSLNQQVIADFSRQLEFSNGLFSNLMLSIEGKEMKLEDVADRTEKKDSDKKDTDKKDAAKAGDKDKDKDKDKKVDTPDVARVFQFTIDCDYNKPRAEGEKPASTPPGK